MPLTASIPTSPDPGTMSRPSSVITRALSPSTNDAVLAAPPPLDTDCPMPRASDDENASASSMLGWWRSRPCFVCSLHITPDETVVRRRADRPVQVGLPPHHTLGHARGAPGVEHDDVVAAAAPRCHRAGAVAARGHVLVRRRPWRARPAAVVDPEPKTDSRD